MEEGMDGKREKAARNACGVGLQLETGGGCDDVVVVGCLDGSPAQRSGAIQSGDVLDVVNGVSVAGLALWRVREAILGQPGTAVRLEFRRGPGGFRQVFEVVLVRQATSSHTAALTRDAPPAKASWSEAAESTSDSALHKNDLDHTVFDQGHLTSAIWASRGGDLSRRASRRPVRENGSAGIQNATWHDNAPSPLAGGEEGLCLSGYKTASDRDLKAWIADGEEGFHKNSGNMRESEGFGRWEWVSRYAIGTDKSWPQDEDPFLPSLSVSPEQLLRASQENPNGQDGSESLGRSAEPAMERRNRSFLNERSPGQSTLASRPPLPSPSQRDHSQSAFDKKRLEETSQDPKILPERLETDSQRGEELHARVAVLDNENKRLKQRVHELEAMHRSVEEAEDHARQAKQANREMDERLLGQLERIEDLKRHLHQARERESALEQKVRAWDDERRKLGDLKRVEEVVATARLQVSEVKDALFYCDALFTGLEEHDQMCVHEKARSDELIYRLEADIEGERARFIERELEYESTREREREEERMRTQAMEHKHQRERSQLHQELESEKTRASDSEAELWRRKTEAEVQEAKLRQEKECVVSEADQWHKKLEEVQSAWHIATAQAAELRWLLQQREADLEEAERTCREAEAALDLLQRRNDEYAAVQNEYAESRFQAETRRGILLVAAQEIVHLACQVSGCLDEVAGLYEQGVKTRQSSSQLLREQALLVQRIETLRQERVKLENEYDRRKTSLEVVESEVVRARKVLRSIAREVETRRSGTVLKQARAGDAEREADETLEELRDLLESPSNGLLVLNRCMIQLLQDYEDDQDVDQDGMQKDGVEFEQYRGGGLDLLMGVRGRYEGPAAKTDPERAARWEDSWQGTGNGEAKLRLESTPGGGRGDLSCSGIERVDQMKSEARALSDTRDELLTETEGLLGEIASLVERRSVESRCLAEVQRIRQMVQGKMDEVERVLMGLTEEVGELVDQATEAHEDVQWIVRGLVEMKATHRETESKIENERRVRLHHQEDLRRDHEHLLAEVREVVSDVFKHASALKSCALLWSEQGAQVYSDFMEQTGMLERELLLYARRLAEARGESEEFETMRANLQEAVADLKKEEEARRKDLQVLGAELKRLEQEEAMGVTALAATQQKQKQGEQALHQLQDLVEAEQAQVDRLGEEMHVLQQARVREQQHLAAERALVEKERQQCSLLETRVQVLRGDLREATARARAVLDEQTQQQADWSRAEAEEAEEQRRMLVLHAQHSSQTNQEPHVGMTDAFPSPGSLLSREFRAAFIGSEDAGLGCPHPLLIDPGEDEAVTGLRCEEAAMRYPTQPARMKTNCPVEVGRVLSLSGVNFSRNRLDLPGFAPENGTPRDDAKGDLSWPGDGSTDTSQLNERANERARLRHELHMLHDDVSSLARES